MKQYLIAVLFISIATTASAQFTKGNCLITLSGNLHTTGNTSDQADAPKFNYYGWGIQPGALFFLNDNVAFGMNIGYAVEQNNDGIYGDLDFNYRERAVDVGIEARYYVITYKKINLFTALYADFERASYRDQNNIIDFNGNAFVEETESFNNMLSIGFQPGITAFLTERLLLEMKYGQLAYTRNITTSSLVQNPEPRTQFDLQFNETLTLGIVFKIN